MESPVLSYPNDITILRRPLGPLTGNSLQQPDDVESGEFAASSPVEGNPCLKTPDSCRVSGRIPTSWYYPRCGTDEARRLATCNQYVGETPFFEYSEPKKHNTSYNCYNVLDSFKEAEHHNSSILSSCKRPSRLYRSHLQNLFDSNNKLRHRYGDIIRSGNRCISPDQNISPFIWSENIPPVSSENIPPVSSENIPPATDSSRSQLDKSSRPEKFESEESDDPDYNGEGMVGEESGSEKLDSFSEESGSEKLGSEESDDEELNSEKLDSEELDAEELVSVPFRGKQDLFSKSTYYPKSYHSAKPVLGSVKPVSQKSKSRENLNRGSKCIRRSFKGAYSTKHDHSTKYRRSFRLSDLERSPTKHMHSNPSCMKAKHSDNHDKRHSYSKKSRFHKCNKLPIYRIPSKWSLSAQRNQHVKQRKYSRKNRSSLSFDKYGASHEKNTPVSPTYYLFSRETLFQMMYSVLRRLKAPWNYHNRKMKVGSARAFSKKLNGQSKDDYDSSSSGSSSSTSYTSASTTASGSTSYTTSSYYTTRSAAKGSITADSADSASSDATNMTPSEYVHIAVPSACVIEVAGSDSSSSSTSDSNSTNSSYN